jgi:hypothetical protein
VDAKHVRRGAAVTLGFLAAVVPVAQAAPSTTAVAAPATSSRGTAARAVPRPTAIVRGAGNVGPAVARYRNLLGPDNGGDPLSHASGRREINWDAVPDALAAPHALPGDYFNAAVSPRARGAVLSTPGAHVAVSADASNPDGAAVRFGDVNPSYPTQFRTFSAERLFSPIGSNVVNLRFFVPGTHVPAVVRGFGAVYTDIDRRHATAFEYFAANGRSLGTFSVPAAPSGLSFLGVVFAQPVVARVRIEYGNHALGPDDGAGTDVAVMDDFLYGEPQPAT